MFGRNKKKHIFYNLNWKKRRSGKKYQNAINWYIFLLKRQQRDGQTVWVTKTMDKAMARLRSYGIVARQVESVMTSRGLDALMNIHQQYLGSA